MVRIAIKKKTLQNIGLIFLGIFLGLIILEAVLRIGGFTFLAWQRYENSIVSQEGKVYRILALGESTTANLHNGRSTWPEELEIMLNNRSNNIKFKVFNEGLPGTTTSVIIANLNNNLDKYKPDMVITMMGVNDELYESKGFQLLKEKGRVEVKIMSLIENLRDYKLIKRIIQGLKYNAAKNRERDAEKKYKAEEEKLIQHLEINPTDTDTLVELEDLYRSHGNLTGFETIAKKHVSIAPEDPTAFYNLGLAYVAQEKYMEAEKMFNRAAEIYPHNDYIQVHLADIYTKLNMPHKAIDIYKSYIAKKGKFDEDILIRLAKIDMAMNNSMEAYKLLYKVVSRNPKKVDEIFWIGNIYQELNKTDEALALFDKTMNLNPDNYAPYVGMALYKLENNKPNEAQEIFDKAEKIDPFWLIAIYNTIGSIYERKGLFGKADEMFNKATELRKSYYSPTTEQNYRELYNEINGRGIKLFIMQYPTRSIENLKNIFRRDENITFVSNENNFRIAVQNSSYDDLFIDCFGGPFGHATKKGNQLIAENLANELLNLVNK